MDPAFGFHEKFKNASSNHLKMCSLFAYLFQTNDGNFKKFHDQADKNRAFFISYHHFCTVSLKAFSKIELSHPEKNFFASMKAL